MTTYEKSSRLYGKLLPSFTLMAAIQRPSAPWTKMPSILAQARACDHDIDDYLQTVTAWAGLEKNNKDMLIHYLEELPAIEKAYFNQPSLEHSQSNSVTLVESDDLDVKHRWQVRIPTPFGECGVGGAGNVITDTDFFNFVSPNPEKVGIAESVFADNNTQPLLLENPGTLFTKEVRKKLLSLPQGYHVSYGFLGKGKSARAVGSAMRDNPFIVKVPCHRVLGHKFSLNGYAGGAEPKHLARKIAIILYERLRLGK